MPVPNPPFFASAALIEFFGSAAGRYLSGLAGQGGGPGVPFFLSAFAGRSASVAIALSPQDQTNNGGSTAAYTFPGVTAIPASGSPTSYAWGVDFSDGSCAVVGGQGTSAASFRFTGVGLGQSVYASIYCDVVINGVTNRGTGSLTYTRVA